MSNKLSLVQETLELLQDIRGKVYSDVESSVIKQLDEAIRMLEEARCSHLTVLTSDDLLKLLGRTIQFLPSILQLLMQLRDCR